MDESRKLFVGPRLKRLRRERNLSQARMAEELGLSPSYLNLMERNQRPITAQVLIRLAHAYSVDPREFATDDHERTVSELDEVFADPLFRSAPVSRGPRSGPNIRTGSASKKGLSSSARGIG